MLKILCKRKKSSNILNIDITSKSQSKLKFKAILTSEFTNRQFSKYLTQNQSTKILELKSDFSLSDFLSNGRPKICLLYFQTSYSPLLEQANKEVGLIRQKQKKCTVVSINIDSFPESTQMQSPGMEDIGLTLLFNAKEVFKSHGFDKQVHTKITECEQNLRMYEQMFTMGHGDLWDEYENNGINENKAFTNSKTDLFNKVL